MQPSPWIELYKEMQPIFEKHSLFDRLLNGRDENFGAILLTGCQRSGTTWMRKILGETITNATAPKELEAAEYFLGRRNLESSPHRTLVLQATFANVYPECFTRMPDSIPIVLVLRNPFSVCRSMVYNWDSLEVEYAHRTRCLSQLRPLLTIEEMWSAAITLVQGSIAAARQMVLAKTTRLHVILYDSFVKDVEAGLRNLCTDMRVAINPEAVESKANDECIGKQGLLPETFRSMIEERCRDQYEDLLKIIPAKMDMTSDPQSKPQTGR